MKTEKLSYEFLKGLYPVWNASGRALGDGLATHNHSKKTSKVHRVMANNSRKINRK